MKRNKRKGKEGFPIEDRKKVKRKKKIEEKNRIIPDQYRKPGKRKGKTVTTNFYFCLHTADTPSGSAYKRVLITLGKTLYQSITSLFFLLNFNTPP